MDKILKKFESTRVKYGRARKMQYFGTLVLTDKILITGVSLHCQLSFLTV